MCGILGYYSKHSETYTGDIDLNEFVEKFKLLQHRGRDGFGIYYSDNNNKSYNIKNKGLINLDEKINTKIKLKTALGHVRYATYSQKNDSEMDISLQPLKSVINGKEIILVHNGNVPNTPYYDTKYILDFICRNKSDLIFSLKELMNTIRVSYNLIILYDKKMYVVRDRCGIRPLSILENDFGYYLSSETIAFPDNGIVRDILPGEILEISRIGIKNIYQSFIKDKIGGICSFEILYFMNPESKLNSKKISEYRQSLGANLAKNEKIMLSLEEKKDCVVIGIPNSGICAALSYAEKMKLEYKQLITKNPDYHGRTFILSNDHKRQEACSKKFIYSECLKDKIVFLVDDTIVRGNVMRSIIKNVKEKGAKQIHIRIPAPPIINKCQLGIAIKDKRNLLMFNRTIEEGRKILDVDSLSFLTYNEVRKILPINAYNEYFLKEDTLFDSFY